MKVYVGTISVLLRPSWWTNQVDLLTHFPDYSKITQQRSIQVYTKMWTNSNILVKDPWPNLQMFFFFMFLTTVGTSSTKDCRDAWHTGWWPIKTMLWIALMVVPILIPSNYIQIYGRFYDYQLMPTIRTTFSHSLHMVQVLNPNLSFPPK